MKIIYKFGIDATDTKISQTIEKVLSVAEQNGRLQLWAIVDPSLPLITIEVKAIGTGWEINDLDAFEYINTIQMNNGLVFHAFYKQI